MRGTGMDLENRDRHTNGFWEQVTGTVERFREQVRGVGMSLGNRDKHRDLCSFLLAVQPLEKVPWGIVTPKRCGMVGQGPQGFTGVHFGGWINDPVGPFPPELGGIPR